MIKLLDKSTVDKFNKNGTNAAELYFANSKGLMNSQVPENPTMARKLSSELLMSENHDNESLTK